MSIEILRPGMFSTIQDKGRSHLRKYGIPESGVMDEWAAGIANFLVGNSGDSPLIEFTLTGGRLRFLSDCRVALSGADMNPQIDNKPIKMDEGIVVKSGSELSFGTAKRGLRCYLAVSGKWQIQEVMGSHSTYVPGNFGGFEGRALKKGDIIQISSRIPEAQRHLPKELVRYYSKSAEISFMKGPEWDIIPDGAKKQFLSASYAIESTSDRMGIRLKSDKAILLERNSLASSAVIPGSIQLTNGGQPIVLMKDGQTIGGYPRLGTVIKSDLFRLAQIQPGGEIRFNLIDHEEALRRYRLYKDVLKKLS